MAPDPDVYLWVQGIDGHACLSIHNVLMIMLLFHGAVLIWSFRASSWSSCPKGSNLYLRNDLCLI